MDINHNNKNLSNNKKEKEISSSKAPMDPDMLYAASSLLSYISNAGTLGGEMVKRMIQSEEEKLSEKNNED